MTKDEMIAAINGVTNPRTQRNTIYAIGDELNLNLKRTNCTKCLADYVAIIKQELGIIEDASEESGFDPNAEYRYILDRAQVWNGHIIDQYTPVEVIRQFVKRFPKGYYEIIEKPQTEEDTNNENQD